MRPTTATIKAEVKFYEATPKTENSPAHVSRPPANTVQQLGLHKKSDVRIVFEARGTVIYAKTWAEPNRAKRLWEAAYGRSKIRKSSSRAVLDRLEKDVANSGGASRSPLVKAKLEEVRSQIMESDSVYAKDLHALLDGISKAEQVHAEQQLRFNANMKDAADKLKTHRTQYFLNALPSKNLDPTRFTKKSVGDFLDFVRKTADLDLGVLGASPIAYEEAQKAIEFAETWANATPKAALGSPKARCAIDHIVSLILGSGMDLNRPARQDLGKFKWVDNQTLSGPGGQFVRDKEPICKNGPYIYRCGTETVVVKSLHHDDEQKAAQALQEAEVHAHATTGEPGHIVQLLGIVQTPETGPMMVLQHAPNGDANQALLKLQKLGSERASHSLMTMFTYMVMGAKKAHHNGVMHLDLKPENYALDENGAPLLIDFGTSRATLARTMKSPTDSPEFSAPELVNALHAPGTITFEADVWSLGVVLYQFNSPRFDDIESTDDPRRLLPFPHTGFNTASVKLINEFITKKDEEDRFNQLDLDQDNPLHHLIIRMLDPDPSKRPSLTDVLEHPSIKPYANQSAAELLDARELILEPPANQLIQV
ncbi:MULTISPECIES: protein kinase [unclassified Variovorax]|uniref:protein kinase domain-containing protein n=1 Tax=unclassified Variovorax TaxID=663243 RepID=UPI00076D72E0|nr:MULTISPECIES: protein kinase [unclassified Variovorax]KWT97125.1 5'-AMP-activated protein kinase, catalytic alpha-2 chain [Variovorax sp. WDL1]PNG55641.1 Serine/threonine-protein kinase PknK [Variovorax sp. B4]PNG57065.1 Serine/threonine-protein kinase PknK [Variovorax sp. B2]VTV10637.1 Serine/threonine-protein kinase PknK [Variovorax sp. WDL1]